MTKNQSIAARKRWKKVSPEERSTIMRDVALKKHSQMSPEDRRAHAIYMNSFKKLKQKNND
jgi:hypothetical protein